MKEILRQNFIHNFYFIFTEISGSVMLPSADSEGLSSPAGVNIINLFRHNLHHNQQCLQRDRLVTLVCLPFGRVSSLPPGDVIWAQLACPPPNDIIFSLLIG
jgi:hypothetical protein